MAPFVLLPPFELESVPDRAAVFAVFPEGGEPYIGRTARLRRRLHRLLGPRSGASKMLSLRDVARRVEYRLTATLLASNLELYHLARRHFPGNYASMIRLRPANFVKLLMSNKFPRTMLTHRLSGSTSFQLGPFRSRASAENFEQAVLDLFQVRRCSEDLFPSPEHPGCIYGEMGRCLRPCQQVVGVEEYRSEADRLLSFLASGGRSLLETVAAARERFSQEMNFEEALRQHQRYQRIEQALKARDELAADVRFICGVAVGASVEPGCVELRFMLDSAWLPEIQFRVAATGQEMVPLDRRLRELVAALPRVELTSLERTQHLSMLARWFYSSSRDSEWIGFEDLAHLPYRRLVRAISHAAAGAPGPPTRA